MWLYKKFFGEIGIDTIIFQLSVPLDGTGEIEKYIYCFIIKVIFQLIFLDSLFFWVFYKLNYKSEVLNKSLKHVKPYLAVCMSVIILIYANNQLKFIEYISISLHKTTFYEDNYVYPSDDNIQAIDKRNLIMIYMESMEETYSHIEKNGKTYNLIPNLTKLAEENLCFINSTNNGGMLSAYGCSWTMGALFGSETGIPMNLAIDGNDMEKYKKFLPGIVTLGDVLEKTDMKMFLCVVLMLVLPEGINFLSSMAIMIYWTMILL